MTEALSIGHGLLYSMLFCMSFLLVGAVYQLVESTCNAVVKYFNRRYCTRQESLELAEIGGQAIGQLLVRQERLERKVSSQHLQQSRDLRFVERKCDALEVARIHAARFANMGDVEVRRSPRTPRRAVP